LPILAAIRRAISAMYAERGFSYTCRMVKDAIVKVKTLRAVKKQRSSLPLIRF
jgi:hypothetical protein